MDPDGFVLPHVDRPQAQPVESAPRRTQARGRSGQRRAGGERHSPDRRAPGLPWPAPDICEPPLHFAETTSLTRRRRSAHRPALHPALLHAGDAPWRPALMATPCAC